MVELADAASGAAGLRGYLGIDHRNRLRISPEVHPGLVFQGVLPGGSSHQDVHTIVVSLDIPLSTVPSQLIPEELLQFLSDARKHDYVDTRQLAARLYSATTSESLDADLGTITHGSRVPGYVEDH